MLPSLLRSADLITAALKAATALLSAVTLLSTWDCVALALSLTAFAAVRAAPNASLAACGY
ncbi:hypothetical protein LJR056_002643 [Paenibacillus sp. LjRoot56]